MQAETARQHLLEAGVPDDSIKVEDASRASTDRAHLDALPDEDRHAYEEGIQRGGFLVTVHADGDYDEDAVRVLEETPAMDFDERQNQWRASGWAGYRPAQSGQSIGSGSSATAPLSESTANDNRTGSASIGTAATGAVLEPGTAASGGENNPATTTAVPRTDVGEQSMSTAGTASASDPAGLATTATSASGVGLDLATPITGEALQATATQVMAKRAFREDRGYKRVRSYAYEQPTAPAPLPVDQQVTTTPAMEPVPVTSDLLLPEEGLRVEATGDRNQREAAQRRPKPMTSGARRTRQAVGPIAAILGLIAVAAAAIWTARSRNRGSVQPTPDLYRVVEDEESDQLRPGEIIPHDVAYDADLARTRNT
jgi:hypothetical protein